MFWQDKRILVLGYGVTGKAMVSYLRRKGAAVYIYDDKLGFSTPDALKWLEKEKVFLVDKVDMLAVSPGFPKQHSVIQFFARKGIPAVGDVEIAYMDRNKKDWIAITGTNGKTTTTMLIDHLLRKLGFLSQTFGNIGVPILDAVDFKGIPVVEVSSFQLEYTISFRPKVGVFLNLSPDHLDRHGNMESYFNAKLKMFINQSEEDWAVLNLDDKWVMKSVHYIKSQVITFSKLNNNADVFFENGYIFAGGDIIWRIAPNSRFSYPPYLEDLLAALSVIVAMGYKEELRKLSSEALSDFVFARHRMEEVANINGVIFINDSKATNVSSTIAAISGFDGRRLLLILGGSRKNTSYDELAKEIRNKVILIFIRF